MYIKNFDDSDIEIASQMAKLTWGDFYTNESPELQKLIYDFMVEYYDLNRKYSFSIHDTGLKGFILAFKANDICDKHSAFKQKVDTLKFESEKETALNLYDYLESCSAEIKKFVTAKDIILGLFVSIQKGCGKKLLSKLIETGRENGMGNIYLWSDTTCDYDYYQKNGFKQVKEFEVLVNGKSVKTFIYRRTI